MKIYTKTGDKGTTSLVGGDRVFKYELRIQSYGTVDELNSCLGVVTVLISQSENTNVLILKDQLQVIQNWLFNLGSLLASQSEDIIKYNLPRIEQRHVEFLELKIDEFQQELPPLKNFISPGGNLISAHLHVSRAVARRAERLVVELDGLNQLENIPQVIPFLNRLSDYLFVLSRIVQFRLGQKDVEWNKNC